MGEDRQNIETTDEGKGTSDALATGMIMRVLQDMRAERPDEDPCPQKLEVRMQKTMQTMKRYWTAGGPEQVPRMPRELD